MSAANEATAVAWYTRLNGRPSGQDRRDFADWLEADPRNGEAWLNVRRTWGGLGAITVDAEDAAALDQMLRAVEEARRSHRKLRTVSLMLAGLLALGAAGWTGAMHPHLLTDLAADEVSDNGEIRRILLPDGSTLLLDAGSAVDTDFTPDQRRVTLLRGAAHFDVVHAEVPFVVVAGTGTARVLGTAFDVAIAGDDVSVALTRGSLRVEQGDTAALLEPGDGVRYGAEGLGAAGPVDLSEATAWQEGRLVFNNARLGDVIETIGRHHDGRIVVTGRALADRRVGGALPLSDPEAALDALRASVGFHVHRLGGLVLIRP